MNDTPPSLLEQPDPLSGVEAIIGPPKRNVFSVRGALEILRMEIPPQKFVWGELIAMEQLQAVFGQGGLGKSRICLNIALNQILRQPFLNIATGDATMTHLFLGSENTVRRWKHDLSKMTAGLTDFQLEELDKRLKLSTVETPEDVFITLSEDNMQRWRNTVHLIESDMIWVDPWGDCIDGDSIRDSDVRATISKLLGIARRGNPHCGVVTIAHSRTGTGNIAQATGYDAANFGKDSKALYSACRSVINLAPYDESDHPDIVFVHAKNNNGPRARGMVAHLQPETMSYGFREWLDAEGWRERIQQAGKLKGGKAKSKPFDEKAVLEIANTLKCKSELSEELKGLGLPRRTADALVDRLEREGKLLVKSAGSRKKQLIGTPEAFQKSQTIH